MISRRIARLLEGDLRLEPAKRGARFVIDLPLVRSQPPVDATLDPPAEPDPPRPLRVLIVEDHPVNRQLLKAALEAVGHSCAVAENGAEGVQAVREGEFDLVLMDVNMPVMDGLEAVRTLRGEGHALPVVMLSASAGEADRAAGRAAGADGYLAKPVNFAALQATLDAFCFEPTDRASRARASEQAA